MPIDPEQEMLEAEVRDAQAQVEARNAAAGEGGEEGAANGDAAGDAGQGANPDGAGDAGQGANADAAGAGAVAEPSPIEAATNGKFKSVEEFENFLGEVDKLKSGPQIGEEEQKVVDLYRKYGPDAYRYLGLAQTDVTGLSPKDVLIHDFAIQNPNLSMEEVNAGWERELKNAVGLTPTEFIDFEDEDTFGQDPYIKGKLQQLISDKRNNVAGFFSNMIPNLLKEGQESGDAGSYNTPVYSDEDKKAFAQEASAFTKFRPDYVEALGEDGSDLEIAVNEIPGFAEVANQIVENPQAFLEATFMKDKPGGGKTLNVQALLNFAASQAGNPLILQKHAQKIGESRYADGLAEGTNQNADEIRSKLGLIAKGADKAAGDGLTDDQRKKAAIQAKADEITRKMAGMGEP